jgi:uncharacterized protein involved in exopolysaccharide biosynthesis
MDADDRFDSPHNPTQVGSRSILRRLAGHWRGILLLWLVLAAPAAYLIYTLVEPTYEAFSLLQVQPTQPDLFGPAFNYDMNQLVAQPYLETQVQLIGSDKVLDSAISRPASSTTPMIASLPMIALSKDPKVQLRKEMVVEVVKNTFMIRVALTSRNPQEAAAIVNAVVDSYLEQHSAYRRSANKMLKASLEEELHLLDLKIAEKKKELREVFASGHIIPLNQSSVKPKAANEDAAAVQPALVVTEEQYTIATDRLLQADLDLIDAKARLEAARDAETPALAEKLPERKDAVDEAKRKRAGYAQYIQKLEVQGKSLYSDPFNANMVIRELESLQRMQEIIAQKLEELHFESKHDVYRITMHDRAQAPKVPATNKRLIYMPAAAAGILFLIVGLFLIQELKPGRVGDTDGARSEASA